MRVGLELCTLDVSLARSVLFASSCCRSTRTPEVRTLQDATTTMPVPLSLSRWLASAYPTLNVEPQWLEDCHA